jgi:di/tricarboxylate transporter
LRVEWVSVFFGRFRLYFGGIILLAIIGISAAGTRDLLICSCVGAMILLACKSITINEAFAATQPRVLLTVISSFGIGKALLLTGLASWIAKGIVNMTISGGLVPRVLFVTRGCCVMQRASCFAIQGRFG